MPSSPARHPRLESGRAAVPRAATTTCTATSATTTPPVTTSGGAEVGKRLGLPAHTDLAEALPTPPCAHAIYMPDTEAISDEDIRARAATPPRLRPILVVESRTVHFILATPIAQNPKVASIPPQYAYVLLRSYYFFSVNNFC
jgi:hypothetical protein